VAVNIATKSVKATPTGADDLLGVDRSDNSTKLIGIATLPITQGQVAGLNEALTAKADATALDSYVQTTDSRLSDARTPLAHTQAWSTITDTPTTLAGYGITDGASEVNPADLLSADADNAATTGTDGGIYVPQPPAGGMTTATYDTDADGVLNAGALPFATLSTPGAMRPDGVTTAVDAEGTLSVIGGDAVESVNGQTGAVVLGAADVGADPSGTATSAVTTHNSDTAAHGMTTFGRSILQAASAAAARTILGLGSAALAAVTDFAAAIHQHAAGDITSGTLDAARIPSLGTSKIDDDAVTYAKLQNVSATARLLGRVSSGAGDVEEIPLGTGLAFSGGALTATGGSSGSRELGYAQITSHLTTSSLTFVDVTGLSLTVTVGSQPIKITVYSPAIDSGPSGSRAFVQLVDVTGGNVEVQTAQIVQVSTNGMPCSLVARLNPGAGSRAYKVRLRGDLAGSYRINATATAPAFMLVEAL
jgi:hypothetical protein